MSKSKKLEVSAGCVKKAAFLLYLLIIICLVCGCRTIGIMHDVKTEKKPWTHLNFCNNQNNFHFAILSDRFSGEQPGIFPAMVKKINLLQPEFVISVGDLIHGYSNDKAELRKRWAEFNNFLESFDMPFFYLPGNHDVSNSVMAELWEELYGRRYYYFIYKNVLFLCLDSQELPENKSSGGLSLVQVEWAKTVLKNYPHVRWTFIFMHQPLWIYEENNLNNKTGEYIIEKGYTGFPSIEEALQGREYTVFVGHFHSYAKYIRHKKRYFILGTTGGGKSRANPFFDKFDHAVWVTMASDGPKVANLLPDETIVDEDICTETHAKFKHSIAFQDIKGIIPEEGISFTLPVNNIFDQDLHCELKWDISNNPCWTITPIEIKEIIQQGVKKYFSFKARCSGEKFPLPDCVGKFIVGNDFIGRFSMRLPADISAHLRANRPITIAKYVVNVPVIDGRLDDFAWGDATRVHNFISMDGFCKPQVLTESYAAYDDNYLYVAFRCSEPEMDKIKTEIKERDGEVWKDDSVEVSIDTFGSRGSYYKFIINAVGVVYDSLMPLDDKSFNATVKAAIATEKEAWIVEVMIPWKDMNITAPIRGTKMGLFLARIRPHTSEVMHYPPHGNYNRASRSELRLE